MNKILAKILENVLSSMSGNIRAELVEFVGKLEISAAATTNPWDDLLVDIIKVALDIA